MKHGLKRLLLGLGLAAFCATPFAVFDPVNDDTDLFRNNPNIPAERPNVLIILDNTANWSSGGKFANEKAALVSTVAALDSSFNVGMMVMGQGGNCRTANVDGGYVRFGVRQMTTANKAGLTTLVNGFTDASCGVDLAGDQGSSASGAQAMHEAYLYFAGLTSRAGITQVKRDFTSNPNNTAAGSLPDNPLSSNTATVYSAAVTEACQKNYIIFISNGPFDNGDDAPSAALYAGAAGLVPGATPISLSPSGSESNWSDEYAFYLANTGVNQLGSNQKIFTYTVDVDPATTGQGPAHTALLKSMAQQGKGKYFGVTSGGSGAAIVDALLSIFSEIQAVNSVFAASTLPVSVNVRGTNLNQLYIGVFRPDAADRPRWLGNLKAYQLKKDPATGVVFTVDKNLDPAINSTTGFITSTAISFWTDPALPSSTYWSFRTASVNGVGGSSDSPDGDLVEKGGAAQQLRARYFAAGINAVAPDPARPLYTCTQGPAFPVCNTTFSATPSLLSATPFVDANSDIDAGTLSIGTRLVSPLTAAVTKPITALKDTRDVTLNNATGFVQTVSSITTNTTTQTASSIGNTRTVSVTSMSNGATSQTASFSKQGTKNRGTLAGHGMGVGQTVIVTGTTSFNTTGTTITAATSNTFDYGTFAGAGNPTESGTVTTSNTVVNATAPSHGFTNGQTVTIAGATPTSFNGAKTITFIDANTFSYSNTVALAPSGTITATAPTTTVTVNFAAAHGMSAGQSVVIAGASPTSYNGTYTITSVPSATSFTYTTGSAITTANTGTVTASTSGTTATATVTAHGFNNGNTVNISGATPAGFNGAFTVANATANTFDYTVAAGLGTATANPIIQVTTTLSPVVTATLANHGFTALSDFITIAGAASAPHNGSFQVLSTPNANTFTYDTGSTTAPGGSPTVRLTTSPLAYATITGHGYGSAGTTVNPFIVSGASPSGYNGTFTATVVDTNTVSYPLSSAQGTSSGTIIATTHSTTANGTSAAHNLIPGQVVTISGATPSNFNGTFTIATTPSVDTFTYTLASAQGAATGAINLISSGSGASERTNVINWVRGEDNFEDENANSSFNDTRASMHGDVLHSRPAVVNYNRRAVIDPTNADNDVYIFYGGNDGVFRAIKGGFGSTTGDPAPGVEVWGFIAKEHFGNLKRLRLNSPAISSNFKKPYFFDGPMGTFTLNVNPADGQLIAADGDKVYIYLTMRRGGRAIYALDVSDPLVPKLLWRKGCPSLSTNAADIDALTGCDLGWGELGQTWSEPKVVVSINASSDPVLIFGAGYDSLVEDLDPVTVTSSTASAVVASGTTFTRSMGRGIYVVNAQTGAIIWQASGHARADSSTHPYKVVSGMDYSIPSDIAVVVGDPTLKPFRAYVGDTGGQFWRFDFGNASPANWTVVKLASIADPTATAVIPDPRVSPQTTPVTTVTVIPGLRKFLFPPDVVGATGYDMVIAGTGDREHPFDGVIVNRVYAFKDKVQTTTPPVDASSVPLQATITQGTGNGTPMLDVTSNCIQVPANCTGTAPQADGGGLTASQNTANALAASTNFGWFLTFAAGEKQVGGTLAAGTGSVVFGTNQPSASAGGGACSPNLGVARQYSVNFENGTAFTGTSVSTAYAGGGFLPSPVLVYVGLGGTTGTGTGTTGGVPVGGSVSGGQLGVGAGASLGGGNDPTGVVCYGASCALAPGKQLYSRLRKFWYKEID